MNAARVSGCTAVQLDATAPEMRARELDRSARRDIAAILRRNALTFTGLDLWIPEEHYLSPQHADRAIEAVIQAFGLAGDLARLVENSSSPSVCIALPEKPSRELVSTLVSAAMSAGVRIADYHAGVEESGAVLGVGIDPATELLAQRDPVRVAGSSSLVLHDARLTDATPRGRMVVGQGNLDIRAYHAVLRTLTLLRHVVIDTRDVTQPADAAQRAGAAWRASAVI